MVFGDAYEVLYPWFFFCATPHQHKCMALKFLQLKYLSERPSGQTTQAPLLVPPVIFCPSCGFGVSDRRDIPLVLDRFLS